MSLATLAQILEPARQSRHAVAGLVVLGYEDAKAFVEAAEETGLPVILQAGPGCRRYTPVSTLGLMFRDLAMSARVPICCHIDHATTFEECRAGIAFGFTSVMIDGSALPLEDNIALTRDVVKMAHAEGVSVEGEVGQVGYQNGAASNATNPEDAVRFVTETGVDALAISVGNVHLQTETKSEIDLITLAEITKRTDVPLVLHGSSGIPVAMRQHLARHHRICKFNIGTELRMAFGKALRQSLADQPDAFDRIAIMSRTIAPMRQETIRIIRELRDVANA
jgi:fructose-bisphosphate aldolase, class II